MKGKIRDKEIRNGYWDGYSDRTTESFRDACRYISAKIFEMQRDGKTSDEILDFIVKSRVSIEMQNLHNEHLRSQNGE